MPTKTTGSDKMQQPPTIPLPTMHVATPVITVPNVTVPQPLGLPTITPLIKPGAPLNIPMPTVTLPTVPTPGQTIIPRTIPTVTLPTMPTPGPTVTLPTMPTPGPTVTLPTMPIPMPTPTAPRPAVQIPTVTMPKLPGGAGNVPPQTVGGGLLKQLGGAGVTVVPAGATTPAMTAPPKTLVEETPYSLLSRIMPNNDLQVQRLIGLHYVNGTPIIDLRRMDIINEIIGMLRSQSFESVIQFLTSPECTGPDYIMWSQKSMDEGRIKVARELVIQRAEEVGVKGVGKCRNCASTELAFASLQLRSGDEPATTFVRCVQCGKSWRG